MNFLLKYNLQCSVSFSCTTSDSVIHLDIYSFWDYGYCKILNIVPCAIQ